MPVKIHGNEYATVAERIAMLHKDHENISITTEIISMDEQRVTMKATLKIGDNTFTGHATERWDDATSLVNKTSALENGETSAVGRALAFASYLGNELEAPQIASANEVASAIQERSRTAAAPHPSRPVPDFESHRDPPKHPDTVPCTTAQLGLLFAAMNDDRVAPSLRDKIVNLFDQAIIEVTEDDINRDKAKGLSPKDTSRGLTGPYAINGNQQKVVPSKKAANELITEVFA